MSISYLTTLITYMVVCSFTPGPGNILSLNATTRFGWKKSKALILGICLGYGCVQLICTLAVYSISTTLSNILDILKYAGFCYMLWLAVHILISKPNNNKKNATPAFRTGFLLQLVNVKIYFYIITLVSVYFIPYTNTLWGLTVAGIIAVLIGSTASLVWAFAGLKLQRIYTNHYKIINGLLSLSLLFCSINILGG